MIKEKLKDKTILCSSVRMKIDYMGSDNRHPDYEFDHNWILTLYMQPRNRKRDKNNYSIIGWYHTRELAREHMRQLKKLMWWGEE